MLVGKRETWPHPSPGSDAWYGHPVPTQGHLEESVQEPGGGTVSPALPPVPGLTKIQDQILAMPLSVGRGIVGRGLSLGPASIACNRDNGGTYLLGPRKY